ncbi:MAG TPA: glycogen debranching protein GlgX [Candidatus Binatia bacterium]|nr:glycogen debranching protein GlgX [Candidatus Binatia bacterium]
MEVWPGEPHPLGAHFDGEGTNVACFAEHATRVELCLFDDDGRETRVALPEVTAHCWHGYLPAVRPGQRYGFRVHGPFEPTAGQRHVPAKLLLDPYARAIDGDVRWDAAVYAYRFGDPATDLSYDDADSAPFVPKAVVVDPRFDWAGDRLLRTPWPDTVIYEVHVKGFTVTHPRVPPEQRGTFAGLSSPAAIDHLLGLGVTAVELLPIHHLVHDHRLVERGLRNYWGYDSIGFFAPYAGYSASGTRGAQVAEFKAMVRALHAAGIEVILDVVYNHTAEGSELGPTLAFRGLDNVAYYRLAPDDPRSYVDYTGCGNSLNMRHPHVLQLIMDSLRYWVTEMHVDGFRFDLAATLARELHEVDRLAAFFDVIQQDPVVSRVKLIAEPWDIGEGGYQVGNFPPLWSEWNGKYRDAMRDFWRGEENRLAEFASRLTGSSDLYQTDGRKPYNSINFPTAHDGFTLADLVAYDEKHNEANGEENRDGESHNRSWNCGVEGPTDDPAVQALRARQQRNLLATLFLSQGVPMLLGGDEIGRSQQGNNNAYCQDNGLSWFDWTDREASAALLAFVRRLVALRKAHPVLRRQRWFRGGSDVRWFNPNAEPMTDEQWQTGFAKALTVYLNGAAIPSRGPRGEPILDDSFLLVFNAHAEPIDFRLPGGALAARWAFVLSTAAPDRAEGAAQYAPEETVRVEGRSVLVLRRAA